MAVKVTHVHMSNIRGDYKCSRCGQSKRGHVCSAVSSPADVAAPLPRAEKPAKPGKAMPAAPEPAASSLGDVALPPSRPPFSFPAPHKQLGRAEEELLAHLSHLRLVSTALATMVEARAAPPAFGGEPAPRALAAAQLSREEREGVRWLLGMHALGRSGILCGASARRGADDAALSARRRMAQAVAFVASLAERGARGPVLVCAPPSLVGAWQAEFHRIAPHIVHAVRAEPWRGEGATPSGEYPTVFLSTHGQVSAEARALRGPSWQLSVLDVGATPSGGCVDWAEALALSHAVALLHPGHAHGYHGTCSYLLASEPPPCRLPVLWPLRALLLLPPCSAQGAASERSLGAIVGRAGERAVLTSDEDEAALTTELRALLGPCVRCCRAPVARVRLEPIFEGEGVGASSGGAASSSRRQQVPAFLTNSMM